MTDSITRQELHHRKLDLRYYKRSDGLFEVVGELMDTKPHAFALQLRDEPLAPHTPIHHMVLTLVLDDQVTVQDVHAQMKATPFGVCLGAQHTLGGLIGMKIGPGWNKKVKELLGGSASCTHLMEMLGPMATTALQGMAPQRLEHLERPENEHLRRAKVNSCFSYAEDREVVAQLWPDLHRAKGNTNEGT